MKRFKPVDTEEAKELFLRIRDKSIDEIVSILGAACRVIEPKGEERFQVWTKAVEVRRIYVFTASARTIDRFWVYECSDGKCRFHAQGKEIK